jgi:5-formyltetrahydrofolate cyclo-ligase
VTNPHNPRCGIVWDMLDPQMLATIPPLQELQAMEAGLPPLA